MPSLTQKKDTPGQKSSLRSIRTGESVGLVFFPLKNFGASAAVFRHGAFVTRSSSTTLLLVHKRVGLGQECFKIRSFRITSRNNPGTERETIAAACCALAGSQILLNAACDVGNPALLCLRNEDGELITSNPGNDIRFPEAFS